MGYLAGLGVNGRFLYLAPGHGKYEIIYKKKDEEEASKAYEAFKRGDKRMYLARIKIFFCKHREEYDLYIGSKRYHYLYCPDCNRAIYVNDETEEEMEARVQEHREHITKERVEELNKMIESAKRERERRKKELEILRSLPSIRKDWKNAKCKPL